MKRLFFPRFQTCSLWITSPLENNIFVDKLCGRTTFLYCLFYQGCRILEKSWIAFAVLESPWISFFKSWKMFMKFYRDLPGQNVKFFYNNWYLVIVQSHCWINLHCEVLSESPIVLFLRQSFLYADAQTKNRYLSPNPTLNLTQTVTLALTLMLKWAPIFLLFALLFFSSSSFQYARVQISTSSLICQNMHFAVQYVYIIEYYY